MNSPAKSISILVFASLGLIAFPLAVYSQQHLYADGAVFTARLLETGRMLETGFINRFLGHVIMEFPTFLFLHIGISNISTLSRVYGASLYYFPYICYAIATWFLFRKSMDTHATLLVLMCLILIFFTSYYMDQEAHLASGLFVLTLSIIATCNLQKVAPLLALFCVGTVATACYEFWAIFFPVCIVFFLYKVIGQTLLRPIIKSLQVLLLILYFAGAIINTVGIFSPQYAVNRQDILHSLIYQVLPLVLASCFYFGLVVLFSCFGSTLVHIFKPEKRSNVYSRFQSFQRAEVVFPLAMLIIFSVSVFLYFHVFPKPEEAFALRSLHLFLPLIFAASFLFPTGKVAASTSARRIALFCVLPMLILTMQASLFHTTRWLDFKRSFYTETKHQSGYVPVDQVKISNPSFLWGWTSPTLSILFQAMQGSNVESIFFNPKESYQPFAPSDYIGAEDLARSLHVKILFPIPNNPEDTVK